MQILQKESEEKKDTLAGLEAARAKCEGSSIGRIEAVVRLGLVRGRFPSTTRRVGRVLIAVVATKAIASAGVVDVEVAGDVRDDG